MYLKIYKINYLSSLVRSGMLICDPCDSVPFSTDIRVAKVYFINTVLCSIFATVDSPKINKKFSDSWYLLNVTIDSPNTNSHKTHKNVRFLKELFVWKDWYEFLINLSILQNPVLEYSVSGESTGDKFVLVHWRIAREGPWQNNI